jgi:lysylphosphatidylglycerol synthetase-like protein (DUF2156 family)
VSEPSRREPGIITALGVFSVLFAFIFLIASVHGLLAAASTQAEMSEAKLPRLLTGAVAVLAYLRPVVNLALYGLLLAAGIGLMRPARWGFRLGRTYAVAQIGWSLVAGLVTILLTLLRDRDTSQLLDWQAAFMTTQYAALAITIHVAGILLSVLWAVVLLVLLSRADVRRFFEPAK